LQTVEKKNLPVIRALGRRFARRNRQPGQYFAAQALQPIERRLFNNGFADR